MTSLIVCMLFSLAGCEGSKNPKIEIRYNSLSWKAEITSAEMIRGTEKNLPENVSDEEDVLHVALSTDGIEGNLLEAMKDSAFRESISILHNDRAYPLKDMMMSYTAGSGVDAVTLVFYLPIDTPVADCTLEIDDNSGQREYSIINTQN